MEYPAPRRSRVFHFAYVAEHFIVLRRLEAIVVSTTHRNETIPGSATGSGPLTLYRRDWEPDALSDLPFDPRSNRC